MCVETAESFVLVKVTFALTELTCGTVLKVCTTLLPNGLPSELLEDATLNLTLEDRAIFRGLLPLLISKFSDTFEMLELTDETVRLSAPEVETLVFCVVEEGVGGAFKLKLTATVSTESEFDSLGARVLMMDTLGTTSVVIDVCLLLISGFAVVIDDSFADSHAVVGTLVEVVE